MKAVRKSETVNSRNLRWESPINVNKYNRSPYLTESEKEEIKFVVNQKSKWYLKTYKILERLLQPLNDALDVTNPNPGTRSSVVKVIFYEINKRQTSFWAWQEEDWAQIITYNTNIFIKEYKVPQDTRNYLVALIYLLFNFDHHRPNGRGLQAYSVATKVFGEEFVNKACDQITEAYLNLGYGRDRAKVRLYGAICDLLLANRSPHLEDLTIDILESLRKEETLPKYIRVDLLPTSCALASLGIITEPLPVVFKEEERFGNNDATANVSSSWLQWCQRWYETSTLAPKTRISNYYQLLKVGRWLNQRYPEITTPEQWTRQLAIEFVAEVAQMKLGDYTENIKVFADKIGQPLSPRGKNQFLGAMRRFLRDCQEWEWIPRHFSPEKILATPHSIRDLISPNPRVIADDIWAKLLWAGLNISQEDLPRSQYKSHHKKNSWYPIEMIQAITITWLFSGIRRNEIYRLRVGCIRWQKDDVILSGTNEVITNESICFLEVPVNKTSSGYTKPVDRVLGDAIEAWVKIRPKQPPLTDKKDGSLVNFLFCYRGRTIGENYINDSIIPMLCEKAGIPAEDAKGNITSHRARSTIATQLANSKDPMTLLELKDWLGHADVNSTINYVKATPTRLAKSYKDAEYFKRNLRTIEVLIDHDAIRSGEAAQGKPYLYYNLGHGWCRYEFFDTCSHRMACAKCEWYLPKQELEALIHEAKKDLTRMLVEIELTEEEQAAIEDDIEQGFNKLIEKLSNVPTPTGKTPLEIAEAQGGQPPCQGCKGTHQD